MTRPKRAARLPKTMDVLRRELTELELTLEEVPVRDLDTDEVSGAWQVSHPEMDGVCRGETPRKALEIFAECLESDDEDRRIDLDELTE